eukprot:Hpha_TRINITY_DN16189_c4_g1::TRINITY_DN16189_c4_g1_i1::g.5329::m.5329
MEKAMANVNVQCFAEKTGYCGWTNDPQGKRLRLRAYSEYRFIRNEEVYAKLLERKEAENAALQRSVRDRAADAELPATPPRANVRQSILNWAPPPQAPGAKRRRV